MTARQLVTSETVFKAMAETGLFDFTDGTGVRRVVIDLRQGSLPIIHVETFADRQLLDVVPSLVGVQIKKGEAIQ